MIDFTTATAATLEPDPLKRVNYVPGLVLGADEFTQEHVYLVGKQRLHNRLLHGYGTISGLAIEPPAVGGADPEILVRPGWAVDQLGREIGVPHAMCVKVNAWLSRHRAYLQQSGFVAGGTLRLCLVLCYKECETDTVPVPGEPCRSQNDVMQPSRIRDAFELRLCIDPRYQLTSPPGGDDLCCCPVTQPEEDAARAFGAILERIAITTDAVTYATQNDLFAEVRRLAPPAGATLSPPGSSPPGGPLYLQPGAASTMLREMFRVWVTEVRPRIMEEELTDPCQRTSPCVLLADIDLPVALTWVMGGAITVDEQRRPFLLHTRLLQEWLLCGRMAGGSGELPAFSFASAFVTGPQTVRAWVHHPVLVTIPTAAVRFSVDGAAPAAVTAVTAVGAALNVFDIALPGPALAGNARVELRFDAAQMTESSGTPRPFTQVLDDPAFLFTDRFGSELRAYAVVPVAAVGGGPPSGPASGDLGSIYPGPTVVALQGRPVNSAAPGNGNVLTWNGAAWVPAAPAAAPPPPPPPLPAGTADVSGTYPALTVVGLRGRIVDTTAPAVGDVLTWDGALSRWAPRPTAANLAPTGPATGDLTGNYPNPAVARIQNRPVASTAPIAGQALAWAGTGAGASWSPQYYVAALNGPYAIVAAGIFDDAAARVGPVYNGLACTVVGGSNGLDFTLTFPGYTRPDAQHTYVVKGTVIERAPLPAPGPFGTIPAASVTAVLARPTFHVVQFNANSIRVRALASNNQPLSANNGSFMVEISEITS